MKSIVHPVNFILYPFLIAGLNPENAMGSVVRGSKPLENVLRPRTFDPSKFFGTITNMWYDQSASTSPPPPPPQSQSQSNNKQRPVNPRISSKPPPIPPPQFRQQQLMEHSQSTSTNQQVTNAVEQSTSSSQLSQWQTTENRRDSFSDQHTSYSLKGPPIPPRRHRLLSITTATNNNNINNNNNQYSSMMNSPQLSPLQFTQQDMASGGQSPLISRISRKPPPIPGIQSSGQSAATADSRRSSLSNNAHQPSPTSVHYPDNEILLKAGIKKQGLTLKKAVSTVSETVGAPPVMIAGHAIYNGNDVFLKCSNVERKYSRERQAFQLIAVGLTKTGHHLHHGHRYVVKRRDEFYKNNYYCLILDDVGDKTLRTYGATLSDSAKRALAPIIFEQLLYGLAFLHEVVGLAHNDIKPANILVNDKNKNNIIFTIIDFDYSTKLTYSAPGVVEPVHSRAGTFGFYPPEMFPQTKFNLCKAESWTLITTIYYFHTRKLNYDYDIITKAITEEDKKDAGYMLYMLNVYTANRGTTNVAPMIAEGEQALVRMDKNSLKLFIIDPTDRPTPYKYLTDYYKKA